MAIKPRSPRPVIWDTSVLLWCLDHSDDPPGMKPAELARRERFRTTTRDMLAEARSSQIIIVVSAMAMAEAANPDRSKPTSSQEKIIDGFLRSSWIKRIAIDYKVATRSRALIRDGVDLWGEDLVQVATAIEYNIPELLTTDGAREDANLTKRKNKKPLIRYNDEIPLADGSGKLKIWSPVQRREEKDRLEAERRKLEQAKAAAEEERRKAEADARKTEQAKQKEQMLGPVLPFEEGHTEAPA